MVSFACGLFLTILVQHLLLLCAPLALVTEIIIILFRQSIFLTSRTFQQRTLSQKLDNRLFQTMLVSSSVANKARILSESAPHSASLLSVVPSAALGLHMEPNEFLVALKWWLGHDLSRCSLYPLCPDTALDPLGHHAVTCRRGDDVMMHHNRLRDVIVDFYHSARLGVNGGW